MITRARAEAEVRQSLLHAPVTTLLGPRQCGKTTLARHIGTLTGATVFDIQDPEVAAAFQNPKLVLSPLEGIIIIDEAQLVPALYPVLRVLVDEDRRTGKNRRFLLLGSAAPELIKGASESLAGRIHMIPLQGFCLDETGPETFARLWHRGGFPDSFLAPDEPQSLTWRKDFVETFLLRDLPQYGVRVPTPELRRLWMMCAHLHGRLLNVSELSQSLGRTRAAVTNHLDILEQSYVIRRLQPWFENIGKRQRKSPKLYLRDSGLLHALLGIQDEAALRSHPAAGALGPPSRSVEALSSSARSSSTAISPPPRPTEDSEVFTRPTTARAVPPPRHWSRISSTGRVRISTPATTSRSSSRAALRCARTSTRRSEPARARSTS